MTESKICTCPSGDGSLRWPCPKHPAVEQAGGDERAVDGKPRATKCPDCGEGDLMPGDLCACGYETDPAAGYACSECDGSGDGYVGEVCRECDGSGWFVTPEQARAALAQPSGEVVVTKNESGAIVSVTRQDKEGRVLSVIAESATLTAQAEQAEAERPEGPTEDELEAAGLGYPLHKEEAVKLWYSGFRSEVITVLEAWEAIGHDTGINPDKEELLDSLRYMLEKCEAHDAALARAAELEKELAMTRDAASKGDAARHAAGGMEMEIQELKAKLAEQAQHSAPEVFGLERYRVERTGQGFWPYCVRAGDGTRELFVGHLKQCKRVAAQLATAFEDGKFIARLPTVQAQHSVPEISGIGRDAEHPRAVVLYLRNEPSDEDMRAIQNFLRAISADV
ncbi:TPA: hypothetical protein ACKP31_006641, partial [Pseudomonas aeruginosa]